MNPYLDDIIPITVEDKPMKELIEQQHPGCTQIKAKRFWRDIHYEGDKAYYNHGKGNKKKEYITYDDVMKLPFQ